MLFKNFALVCELIEFMIKFHFNFFTEPRVSFNERKYFFYEPSKIEKQSTVYVKIKRDGDVTKPTSVSLETSDGSALSGQHYDPFAKVNLL